MKKKVFVVVCGLGFFVWPQFSWAGVPAVYTNANYVDSIHEEPADFYNDGWGGFYGHTASGRLFTQTPVTNDENIRLHKFMIDEAFFYISNKGTIWAESDLAAVSIYLTLG